MYRKLRGRIVERYGTMTAYAKVLGISSQMVSKYISGKATFTAKRMQLWGELLGIDRSEYGDYFFAD